METIILLATGIFALVILFFKARRLVATVKGNPDQSPCNCGNCSSSCAIRKIPDSAGNSGSNTDLQ